MIRAVTISFLLFAMSSFSAQAQNVGGWKTDIVLKSPSIVLMSYLPDISDIQLDFKATPNWHKASGASQRIKPFSPSISAGMKLGGIRGAIDYHNLVANMSEASVVAADHIPDHYFEPNERDVIKAYMVSGEYELQSEGGYSSYMGVGMGLADVEDLHDGWYDGNDLVFAYKFKVGASYDFGENVALFGEYNYLASGDFDYDVKSSGISEFGSNLGFRTHAFNLGLKYGF